MPFSLCPETPLRCWRNSCRSTGEGRSVPGWLGSHGGMAPRRHIRSCWWYWLLRIRIPKRRHPGGAETGGHTAQQRPVRAPRRAASRCELWPACFETFDCLIDPPLQARSGILSRHSRERVLGTGCKVSTPTMMRVDFRVFFAGKPHSSIRSRVISSSQRLLRAATCPARICKQQAIGSYT